MKIEITFHGLADIIRSVLQEANEQIAEQETRFPRSAKIDDPRCGTSFDATETVGRPAAPKTPQVEKPAPAPVAAAVDDPLADVTATTDNIPTIEETRAAVSDYMQQAGPQATREMLAKFGVKSVTELVDKPEERSAIVAEIRG